MHTGCERRRRVKFFAQLSRKKAGRGAGARWAPFSARSPLPLGNVPPGRSGPQGGAKYVRYQKLAQSQVSPPPLGGAGAQWAPFSAWSPLPRRSVLDVCHWQTSPEPAGESGLALARTERASCQSHRPLTWLSPLRAHAPRSLVSFLADAHKVKVKTVGLCPTPRKLFEKSLTKNFYARCRSAPPVYMRCLT